MKGKPPLRRREAARVENKPDLSRKINQICRHLNCPKSKRFLGKGAAPAGAKLYEVFAGCKYWLFQLNVKSSNNAQVDATIDP